MARIAAFDAITSRFCGLRKRGDNSPNKAPSSTMNASTPLTRIRSATSPTPARACLTSGAGIGGLDIGGGGGHDRLLRRLLARELRHEPAFGDDQDALADRQHFQEIGRDDQDSQPLVSERGDDLVYLRLASDIDAMRRLVENQNARL